ncbi:7 transmembrane sweet-taste receptor of 3 GCPR-domain-containing protein, partial [Chytridium lagenaria]
MRTEICVLFSWLKYLGFSLVFGSLIIKTFRISIIFNQKQGKKASDVKINDSFLLLYLGAFLGIWVALLLAWTFIPGQRPRLKVGQVANVGEDGTFESILQTPICDFNAFKTCANISLLVLNQLWGMTVMVLTLISGIFITFRVKDTPSAFNESKWIAYALYNWVVIGVVLSGVSNFAVKDPDAVFVMEALTAIITQTGVIVLIFLPKIVTTLRGNGNAIEAIFRSGRSGSKDMRSALAGDESENSGLVSGTSSQLRKKPSVAVSDQVVMYHAVAG